MTDNKTGGENELNTTANKIMFFFFFKSNTNIAQ